MNYIELANKFWRLNLEKHFTQLEISCYFYLLNLCNWTRWNEKFEVSNKDLIYALKCTPGQLRSARNHLVDAKLIVYYPGTLNKAVSYSFNVSENQQNNEEKQDQKQDSEHKNDLSNNENSVRRDNTDNNSRKSWQELKKELKRQVNSNSKNDTESELKSTYKNDENRRDDNESIEKESPEDSKNNSNCSPLINKTKLNNKPRVFSEKAESSKADEDQVQYSKQLYELLYPFIEDNYKTGEIVKVISQAAIRLNYPFEFIKWLVDSTDMSKVTDVKRYLLNEINNEDNRTRFQAIQKEREEALANSKIDFFDNAIRND